MNDNIKEYKHQIEAYENNMLALYKDLVVSYEEVREIYEKMISKSTSVQKCSVIAVKNGSATLAKFALIDLNGVLLYQTDRYASRETCTIDLRKKSMVEGTQFRLKALVTAGDDDTSEIILEYDPEGPIVKFVLRGSTFKTDLVFEGTLDATLEVDGDDILEIDLTLEESRDDNIK